MGSLDNGVDVEKDWRAIDNVDLEHPFDHFWFPTLELDGHFLTFIGSQLVESWVEIDLLSSEVDVIDQVMGVEVERQVAMFFE